MEDVSHRTERHRMNFQEAEFISINVPSDINKKAWERETCRMILGCIEVWKLLFSIYQRRVSRSDEKIKKATKRARGTKEQRQYGTILQDASK